MANEFKLSKNLLYENGQLKYQWQPAQFQMPQTTQGMTHKTISVTTTTADLDLSEITTQGRIILQSLEATTTGNFVTWGPKTSTGGLLKMGKLEAKESADFYLNSTTTLRWAADTATVNVMVTVFEV